MRKHDPEQQMRREFAEFLGAKPAVPSKEMDDKVLRVVANELRPPPWKIIGKLTLVNVAAGLSTLTVCPQFGLGFGSHSEFLHGLHAATSPFFFYLLCGVIFISLGAAVGGFVLTRPELRAIGKIRKLYFPIYSLLAYAILMILGPEVFVAVSLAWVMGAILGGVSGFEVVLRIRKSELRT